MILEINEDVFNQYLVSVTNDTSQEQLFARVSVTSGSHKEAINKSIIMGVLRVFDLIQKGQISLIRFQNETVDFFNAFITENKTSLQSILCSESKNDKSGISPNQSYIVMTSQLSLLTQIFADAFSIKFTVAFCFAVTLVLFIRSFLQHPICQ